jgi:hypothetical protein
MSLLVLNQAEVEQLLDMEGCIEAMAEALASLARSTCLCGWWSVRRRKTRSSG